MIARAILKGSVVALVSPMKRGGQLDFPAFEQLLRWQLDAGTQGVVIGGSTGESAALDGAELVELLQAARRCLAGSLPIVAGAGDPSTQNAIARCRLACQAGADLILAVTPYYLRTTQAGLKAHFLALADASTKPVILYNVPARTGNDLQPETALELAEHENIVGIKEAVNDMERLRTLRQAGASFCVLSGDDPSYLEALNAGADGIISVTANVAPRQLRNLGELFHAGEAEQARRLVADLVELNEFLGCEPNPVPVKALLAEMGWLNNTLRLPLLPLSAQHQALCKTIAAQLASASAAAND